MAALAKVIRYTSRQHCTGLFESVSVQCPPHWADPVVEPKTIIQEAKALHQAIWKKFEQSQNESNDYATMILGRIFCSPKSKTGRR